jgi:hypothetical protein
MLAYHQETLHHHHHQSQRHVLWRNSGKSIQPLQSNESDTNNNPDKAHLSPSMSSSAVV